MTSRWSSTTRRLRTAALAVLAAGTVQTAPAAVDTYVLDRAHDFLDIFRLRAGVPSDFKGYGAKVRATALAQAGYVHFNGRYAGMDKRGFALMRERRTEGGVSLAYASNHQNVVAYGNTFTDINSPWYLIEDRNIVLNLPYWDDGRGDVFGIGAEIATPIIAFDMGLYPSQFVDFLTSFVLIDPYNDDRLDLEEDWEIYQWMSDPQDPAEPNPEAPVQEAIDRIDAQEAAWVERQLEAEGQLRDIDGLGDEEDAYDAGSEPLTGERTIQTQQVPAEASPPEQALPEDMDVETMDPVERQPMIEGQPEQRREMMPPVREPDFGENEEGMSRQELREVRRGMREVEYDPGQE